MREGIEYKSLSIVCTKITDGSHFSPKEDEDGAYPMLSVKDMKSRGFEYTACKYINEHDYKVLVANGCKPNVNDVLVAKDGSYLKTAFVLKEDREQALLSSIAIITPRLDIINPDYLAFFFKASHTKAIVEKHYLTGTAIKRIILKGFRSIQIPVPPLSEQQRIVSELDLLSSIIEKKKAQLKEYDQLAQSIFYDMFGDPVTNEKGWEVKKLGEVCYIGLGFTHTPTYVDKGVPFLSVKDITGGEIDFSDIKYVSENEYMNAPKGAKPQKGDILFCRVGTMGKPVIIKTDVHFCTFVSLGYLSILYNRLNNIYIKYWMLSDGFNSQVEANVRGLAIKNLNTGWLKMFNIPLPPLPLQQSFASKIEAIERQKALIQQSIAEVQMLFDSRMDDWFA